MADKFVRATGGSDANDGLSFANGWATLQYAFDNLSAGDNLYICSDDSNKFTVTAQIDIDTTSGAATNRIRVIGADLVDGSAYDGSGFAYITTASSITALIVIASSMNYYSITDIHLDGGGSGNATHCIENSSTGANANWQWYNCRFTNADSHNISIYSRGEVDEPWIFENCEIDSSVNVSGIYPQSTLNRAYVNIINCIIRDNDEYGAYVGVTLDVVIIIKGNVVYGNGLIGINILSGTNVQAIICNNVFHGNGGDGFKSNCFLGYFKNNIFSNNGGYGAFITDIDYVIFADKNCYYNNTSGDMDVGTPPGSNNITSDPEFTNISAGSEDFTLKSTSPCIDSGTGYGEKYDIGAAQSSPSGGGSGVITTVIVIDD